MRNILGFLFGASYIRDLTVGVLMQTGEIWSWGLGLPSAPMMDSFQQLHTQYGRTFFATEHQNWNPC